MYFIFIIVDSGLSLQLLSSTLILATICLRDEVSPFKQKLYEYRDEMKCEHRFKKVECLTRLSPFPSLLAKFARESLEKRADELGLALLGLCLLAQNFVADFPIGNLTVPAAVRSQPAARALRKGGS